MKRKVFNYEVSVDWEKEHQGFLGGSFKQIQIACPPEFGGPGGIISPEDLFVASNSVCVMTTFLDFMEKAQIKLVSYKSNATGDMEFIDGYYRFSKIILNPKIVIYDKKNIERTERLLKKAHDVCPVGKSSTCEIILEPEISSEN
ncbi:MAG: OsmC family protein [Caldisericia bacterium]